MIATNGNNFNVEDTTNLIQSLQVNVLLNSVIANFIKD
jgi:hypothetical protein